MQGLSTISGESCSSSASQGTIPCSALRKGPGKLRGSRAQCRGRTGAGIQQAATGQLKVGGNNAEDGGKGRGALGGAEPAACARCRQGGGSGCCPGRGRCQHSPAAGGMHPPTPRHVCMWLMPLSSPLTPRAAPSRIPGVLGALISQKVISGAAGATHEVMVKQMGCRSASA